jgi:PAS domain S-box-containing protein
VGAETPSRIEVGHGHASLGDARAAGRQAALDAASSVSARPLSLVLVFSSVRYDPSEVLRGVREVTGDAPLIGVSTADEIDGDELRQSVVVAVLASREISVQIGAAAGVASDWRGALDASLGAPGLAPYFAGPQRWLEASRAGRSVFALLFTAVTSGAPPSSSHDILEALSRRAGGRLPIFGGAAADEGRRWVLAGASALREGVALAVVETSLQYGIASAHGFLPADEQVLVTAASGHEALELDGRPAAERYAELAGTARPALEGLHLALASGFLLGMPDAYGEHVPLLACTFTARGGVLFNRRITEGMVLRRLRADGTPTGRAGLLALRKAVLRGHVSEPAFVVAACCALRPRILGASASGDVAELARALAGTPLVGFRSSGAQGLDDAGASVHSDGMISVLALGRELSREARVAGDNELLRRGLEESAAELRRSNEQLRWAQAQQHALLDSIADMAWLKDVEGRYLAVNRPFAATLGITPEGALGKRDPELWPPEIARELRAEDLTVMASGSQSIDRQMTMPDGRRRWFEVVKVPYLDQDGVVLGTAAVARDVTERRDVEAGRESAMRSLAEALERVCRTEAQQRALLDGMTDLAWLKDEEGRFIAVNQSFAQMVGRTVEEMVGKTDHDVFDLERAQTNRSEDAAVMASGEALRLEQELAAGDGRSIWVEKIKVPFRDEQGRVAGTVGIARDVTHRQELERLRQRNQEELEALVRDRTAMLQSVAEDLESRLLQLRLAEETLRESEEKYRMLVRATPSSAVFLVDGELRYTLAEGALLEGAGANAQAMIGRRVREHPGPEGEVFAPMLERALAGEAGEAEAAVLGRSVVALRAAPVRAPDGSIRGAMLAAADVTERRRLEEQFRQAQKMEAVGRLAGGVAHDFNNILTVILGSAKDLARRSGADQEARGLAEEVLEAGQRAAALTRQLLAFSRQQALRPCEIDVNEIVRGMEKMLRRLIGADIEIVTRLEDELGPVLADPGQLEQVVVNLVVNARDAMPKGGRLTLQTREVERVPEGSAGAGAAPRPHVLLSVSDTGHGMAPTVLEHVFEPFFTTKERGKGTGLGLATVFGIVKQSGGGVNVTSEPGVGTTFHVYLPRVGEARVGSAGALAEAQAARGKETVLLVEDDAGVRTFMRRSLEAVGYRVLEAKAPGEAVQLAGVPELSVDLLLTDVVMPVMAGPDLAAKLLALRPGLRVLFVSGYTEDAGLRSGTLPPGQAFLQKPFTGDELARTVRTVLDMAVPEPGV